MYVRTARAAHRSWFCHCCSSVTTARSDPHPASPSHPASTSPRRSTRSRRSPTSCRRRARSTARRSRSSRTSLATRRSPAPASRASSRSAGITRRRRRGTATSRRSNPLRATASAPGFSRSTVTSSCSAEPISTTTPAASLASLERLWERRDIDLRERTLWRLLWETAARADEVPRLDAGVSTSPPSAPAPGRRAATSTGCSSARAARGCCRA